jgi:hypothetical protein
MNGFTMHMYRRVVVHSASNPSPKSDLSACTDAGSEPVKEPVLIYTERSRGKGTAGVLVSGETDVLNIGYWLLFVTCYLLLVHGIWFVSFIRLRIFESTLPPAELMTVVKYRYVIPSCLCPPDAPLYNYVRVDMACKMQ